MDGIVCPAQTNRTECCGTCGLCWHENAVDKTIIFIEHGRRVRGKNKPENDRGAQKKRSEFYKPVSKKMKGRLLGGTGLSGSVEGVGGDARDPASTQD
jgi:hypothetical protein